MNLVVNPAPAISPIAPVAAETASREERQQHLQLHQIVRATVAEGGQERVTLELGPQRLQAETEIPLRTGQKLDLQVIAVSPRLELRVVSDPVGERLGQLLPLLWSGWDVGGMVAAVERGPLDRLPPAARQGLASWRALLKRIEAGADGSALRELVGRLGLRLEATLATGAGEEGADTLKAALLAADRVLDEPTAPLAGRAGQLAQTLETFQLAQLRLRPQGTMIVPLPLPFAEQAFLLLRERSPAPPGEPEPPLLLSVHLALQGLGNLRIDLLQDEGGMHLRFLCDGAGGADFLAGFRAELEEAMAAFRLQGVSFAAGAEHPARELVRKLFPDGHGVLDTRI